MLKGFLTDCACGLSAAVRNALRQWISSEAVGQSRCLRHYICTMSAFSEGVLRCVRPRNEAFKWFAEG